MRFSLLLVILTAAILPAATGMVQKTASPAPKPLGRRAPLNRVDAERLWIGMGPVDDLNQVASDLLAKGHADLVVELYSSLPSAFFESQVTSTTSRAKISRAATISSSTTDTASSLTSASNTASSTAANNNNISTLLPPPLASADPRLISTAINSLLKLGDVDSAAEMVKTALRLEIRLTSKTKSQLIADFATANRQGLQVGLQLRREMLCRNHTLSVAASIGLLKGLVAHGLRPQKNEQEQQLQMEQEGAERLLSSAAVLVSSLIPVPLQKHTVFLCVKIPLLCFA
jgi:hypothetical protein